jgi:hypothetical protein
MSTSTNTTVNVTLTSGTGMPGLFTDQTANSLNRFITKRPMHTSQQETNEERPSGGAAISLQALYPLVHGTYLARLALWRIFARDRNNVGNWFTTREPLC